jgi:hypothetical protein
MEVYMEEKRLFIWLQQIVEGRGNSLLLACSILCRSLLNLVDINNCNSNFFWSKHENDTISKLWKMERVEELGVKGNVEADVYPSQ